MAFFDISRPIAPDMTIYPGNPAVSFRQTQTADAATGRSNVSEITLGTHTGTHIDAPSHITSGAPGVETYSLEQLNGPAEVIEVLQGDVVTSDMLPATTQERVLVKTRNSQGDAKKFELTFMALDESAAQELVRRGVRVVGIDAPSIKKKGEKNAVHQILIDAGVAIIEGLWLADVPPGSYELMCLPLPLTGLDGAPVRAVLRT